MKKIHKKIKKIIKKLENKNDVKTISLEGLNCPQGKYEPPAENQFKCDCGSNYGRERYLSDGTLEFYCFICKTITNLN